MYIFSFEANNEFRNLYSKNKNVRLKLNDGQELKEWKIGFDCDVGWNLRSDCFYEFWFNIHFISVLYDSFFSASTNFRQFPSNFLQFRGSSCCRSWKVIYSPNSWSSSWPGPGGNTVEHSFSHYHLLWINRLARHSSWFSILHFLALDQIFYVVFHVRKPWVLFVFLESSSYIHI